ncbi:MAG: aminopeptidase [Pseudomonadota bacterium]|jgi:aminopeptidase N
MHPMSVSQPIKKFLKEYQPSAFQIDTVDLTCDLSPENTQVTARLKIRRTVSGTKEPLILNGEQLTLVSIQLNDRFLTESEYSVNVLAQTLTIPVTPDAFELTIVNRINPKANTALSGLYCSNQLFCTQCEAEGFRRITYFLDRPDIMAVYTTTIIADKKTHPVLLSNGNLVARGAVAGSTTKHYATWHDPHPKPSYLFALVAGPLVALEDYYVTKNDRLITLKIYVEPQNQDSCAHAMEALKRAMQWDEQKYGREYDLDIYMIVAVNDFNMGAMENKGLNIFNAKYILARPEFATDTDFELIDAVVAHEYFHNWSGNRVTCRDWFQLCLKEGLTVFREQHFAETKDSRDSTIERIEQVKMIRGRQFQEDASPMAHPVRPSMYLEINNFYTVTVYEKGAEVIRMLATLVGEQHFRLGMDRYFEDNDGKAATVEDLLQAIQSVTALDLKPFMRWYTQAGTPTVVVTEQYDADNQTYTLNLAQQPPKIQNGGAPEGEVWEPLMIPVAFTLFDGVTGKPYETIKLQGNLATEQVLLLNELKQTFIFSNVKSKPVISLFQGFSAPVKVERKITDETLHFICEHDIDFVNRWDALQQLIKKEIKAWIKQCEENISVSLPTINPFSTFFKRLLNNAHESVALTSLLLQPPSLTELMGAFDKIHLEAIEKAYNHWVKTLAQALREEWIKVYQRLEATLQGPYVFTPQTVATRSLKNLALWYLGHTENVEDIDVCMMQYEQSRHMTDRLAAMRAVMNIADFDLKVTEKRTALFKEYEMRWKHHPLAMNKWFAVQAGSMRPDTLESIEKLSAHPQFSWTNPNNVYALLSTFVMQNPFRFHASNGKGYAFIESAILRLDKENPQVAARLMQGWMDWNKFDLDRQRLMREGLDRLLAQPELSKDVFELADKYRKAVPVT